MPANGDHHDGIHVFRNKHLFAELHELRADGWHETRRWNYGLEEDLLEDCHGCRFGRAHLPSLSVYGAMAFRESLHPRLVLLDVDGTRGRGNDFEPLARAIVEHLVEDRQMDGAHAGRALALLTAHLGSAKRVDHDAELLEGRRRKLEAQQRRASARLGQQHGSLGSLEKLGSLFRGASDTSPPPPPPGDDVARAPSPSLDAPKKHDALAPDHEEEAVQVLVDDDFAWIESDASILVRLRTAVESGLEEHGLVDMDESATRFKLGRALKTRFIVLVLGAGGGDARVHDTHVAMGAAAAALLQDDAIVRVLYEADDPGDILTAIDARLAAVRVLPRTTRPTKRSLAAREKRMLDELSDLKSRLVQAELAAQQRPSEDGSVAETVLGGRVLRLEYADQNYRWDRRQRDVWRRGFTIAGAVSFAQKYALPLLCGIALALVLANTDEDFYNRWCGVSHHGGDDDDHRRALSGGDDDGGVDHPTFFGLRIRRHDVTLHFLVNDILMAFFFGLAVKEICEAFQPGGSLYPPTRKAVNPIFGTLGGVIGPIAFYFIFLGLATSTGAVSDDFGTLARGWGIPTATDISVAWVAAYTVFGAGHPAINFLLLCAIIDDGIGLVIIAVAYQEKDPAVDPEYPYLLLVGVAMAVAYVLRRKRVAQWWVYVALAGPFAWYGLLYAAVHPSLALCFVVPFLPLSLGDPKKDDDESDDDDASDASVEERARHVRSPLHDFEHAAKGFVDFGVLFLFGTVNAGVDLDQVGGYSVVVWLSLLVGKTLGLVGGSALATALGYPRPEGMGFRALCVDGVISSVGLTVSLFIAGEAFSENARVQGQAKFGALLSLAPALVLVAVASVVPGGKRCLVGAPEGVPATPEESALPKIDEDASEHHAVAVPVQADGSDDEEDLEAVVVSNMEHALRRIHRIEARCEDRIGISRSQGLLIMDGLPKNTSDPGLSRRSGSPSTLPPSSSSASNIKRYDSREALDLLIEKHIHQGPEESRRPSLPSIPSGRPPRPPPGTPPGRRPTLPTIPGSADRSTSM